jgi:hypothetical protein
MLAFDHGSYIASCGDRTQIHVGPPSCLSQRLASVTQRLSAMTSKSCACKFVHLPYQLNLWLHISFCPWSLLNPSSTFPSLRMFISLDLMLLLNMIESPLINYLVVSLVNARCAWNYAKISCLVTFDNWAMFSCEVFWSANSFPVDPKPCDYPCLLSLSSIMLVLQPIGATWNFTFVMRLVMVLWVAADGATTKPRASCGYRHMTGCLTRAHITVSSHDPLWNDSRCVIFLCYFLGYLSILYREIHILDRK